MLDAINNDNNDLPEITKATGSLFGLIERFHLKEGLWKLLFWLP